MKAGWVVRPLGLCAKFMDYRGKTPPKTDAGIRLITAKNVKMGFVQRQPVEYIDPNAYNEWMTRGFPEVGDVLFTTEAPLGNVAQLETDEQVVIGQRLITLKTDKHCVDSTYLKYALLSPLIQKEIHSRATGATVQGIKASLLKTVLIPLPPLEEQQRIVAVLDEAFEGLARARAHVEANLQNARELFERQLAKYFDRVPDGWITKRLDQITTKVGSGATPTGGAGAYKPEGIPLIRSLNVHDRWFKEKALAFIDDDQADKLSNAIVEERDVLLNITGASVARCCLAPSEYLPARVNQHVSIIRPEQASLLPEFLTYMLTSQPYKDGLLKTGEDNGSTRQALTKALILNLEVSYPADITQQEEIVLTLGKAESQSHDLITAYLAKLQDLDDLRQSLLQKAFAGELT